MRRPRSETASFRAAALRRPALLFALLAALAGGRELLVSIPAAAAPPTVPAAAEERDGLLRDFAARMRAGDLAAARAVLVRYRGLHPGDALMAYNQACIDARLGDPAASLQALAEAEAAGWDDARGAADDPDLAALADEPAFAALLGRLRARLADRARARTIALEEGTWSPPLPFAGPGGGGSLRARPTAAGLEIEASLPAADGPQDRADDDLLLVVSFPASGDSVDTRNVFRFGFDLAGGAPRGRVLDALGRVVLRAVVELTPVVAADAAAGRETWRLRIPWTLLAPFAPPADTLIGLNARHRRGDAPCWLTPDPAGEGPGGHARFVPLRLRPGPEPAARLHGLVDDTVVGRRPVIVGLDAWLPQDGAGRLRVRLDAVNVRGDVDVGSPDTTVALRAGANAWTRYLDMAHLPDGLYHLSVDLVPAGDDTLSWRMPLLRFSGHWLQKAYDKLKDLQPLDRPTVRYRLDLIRDALADRFRRADPSPVATTVNEVDNLLLRSLGGNTVLPEDAVFVAAIDPGDASPLPCTLRLPAGWKDAADEPLAVLLTGGGGEGWRVWNELVALLDERDDGLLVALPACRAPLRGAWSDEALADARSALEWLRARFPDRPLLLAGLESGAGAALALARRYPDLVTAAFLAVDPAYAPAFEAAADAPALRLPATLVRVAGDAPAAPADAALIPADLPPAPTPAAALALALLAWSDG